MIDNTIKTDIKYLLMRVLFTLGSCFVVVIMSQAGNHDLKNRRLSFVPISQNSL